MRGREILVLLLILFLGIAFSLYEKGQLDLALHLDSWSIFPFPEYEFSEEIRLNPPFPETLALSNYRGKISLIGTDEEKVVIHLTKIIKAKTREEAQQIALQLHPLATINGSQLLVTSNRDEFSAPRVQTNFQLLIPRFLKVNLKNSYGLVRIEDVAAAIVNNPHGAVEATNIAGEVEINNSYKQVVVQNIGQKLTIKSRHSSVKVKQIGQSVLINHRYGPLYLDDIQGAITIEAHHSQVKGVNFHNFCQIETSYQPISLVNIQGAMIDTKNSNIQIIQNQGNLEILNSYGGLKIIDSQGNIQIRGKNLEVTIQDAQGDTLDLETSYRDVDLRRIAFQQQTNLELAHNSIYLAPQEIKGLLRINANYTRIFFVWPEELRVPLRIINQGGQIIWKLDLPPQLSITNGTSYLEAFLQEKNKEKIEIKTSYEKVIVSPSPKK
ncbi:MAG: hypothetical protein DRJ11_10060 [Candidatus Aminicenantes bacterium]|nr:MAG: hypothetical protein DRJ11_10060 [Candidatus Aminicenantes bacterium]